MNQAHLLAALADLAPQPYPAGANLPAQVGAIRDNSRQVTPGDVFVALVGRSVDGHNFLHAAAAQGASLLVVERPDASLAVPQLVVPNSAQALGRLVAAAHNHPARAMTLIGITGTNGKTTTSFLVESILKAAGGKPGVIGTVSYRWGDHVEDAPYTTPTPEVLHSTLARMRDAGCTHVVMEVSSAALVMDRLAGVDFHVGAFSNLTQDHLDVHGSMDAYAAAKQRLFRDHLPAGTAVVNIDDAAGEFMAQPAARVLRVSQASAAAIQVVACDSTVRGITATLATPRGNLRLEAPPLVGAYNVANLALATGIAEALALPHAAIMQGIANLPGVPGRVERVANSANLDILVDYAHTPDALRNVLTALRPLTQRRLICVFGCGGDRDPGKRPLMGAAVAELADLTIVTSDNPRTEAPRAIIDAILPAVPNPFYVDVDRRAAIAKAVCEATPGDVVLIAGKGHEDYQIIGTTKHHFDDREEALRAIALRPSWSLAAMAQTLGVATPASTVEATRIIIDSRIAAPGDLYVAIVGEALDGHAFVAQARDAGAVAALVAASQAADVRRAVGDGFPLLVVQDPRHALGQLAAAHRTAWAQANPAARLVAITGSAGKTTTKELTRAALAEAGPTHAAFGSLNNETGVPLTLLGLRAFHRYGVVEMGMRGAGQIAYLTHLAKPDVGAVVNAGTAHIELLGSTDAIAAAKAELWEGFGAAQTVVRPSDDTRLAAHAARLAPAATSLTFGEAGADVQLTSYQLVAGQSALALQVQGAPHTLHLPLLGKHAALDACCALACARAAGVTPELALAGVARVRNAPMRGEVITIQGRHIIVDCYNANPASMHAALALLAEVSAGHQAVAILGDMRELGDFGPQAHRELSRQLKTLDLGLIAMGQFHQELASASPRMVTSTDDPHAAAQAALAATQPGDWLLLKASRGMRLERVRDALISLASL